jgi:putative transposase
MRQSDALPPLDVLGEAREATEAWLYEYNGERPHGSLGGLTPMEFIDRWGKEDREAA